LRLRRLKAALLTVAAPQGLARVLTPLLGSSAADALAEQWAAQDAAAVDQVVTVLVAAGLSREAVTAQTLAAQIDKVERIDCMIASAEGRRADALREIARHRAGLAAALRDALAAEDAEFEEIDDGFEPLEEPGDDPAFGGRRRDARGRFTRRFTGRA
jgi:hypothetical protein